MVTIELLFQTFSAYNSDIYIPDTAKPIFNVYPTSYSPMKHFNVTSQRIFFCVIINMPIYGHVGITQQSFGIYIVSKTITSE